MPGSVQNHVAAESRLKIGYATVVEGSQQFLHQSTMTETAVDPVPTVGDRSAVRVQGTQDATALLEVHSIGRFEAGRHGTWMSPATIDARKSSIEERISSRKPPL